MFRLKAPAKVNWFLSVRDKRSDGYHNIASLMQSVDLYDDLLFEDSDSLEVISDIPDLPEEQNIVYKAAKRMAQIVTAQRGARITLTKEIPLAAGMGGGSSDAASALRGLDRLWGTNLGTERLREIGASIGSDVPFFIGNAFALVEGRGERIKPLQDAPELSLLLVNPRIPVSTAWAYRSCQIELTKKPVDIKLFCQALARKDFDTLNSVLVNDLEKAVVTAYPEIAKIKDSLRGLGASAVAMSGSGPTVFGVFRSEDEAQSASHLMGTYWRRVVRTLSHVPEQ